MKGIIGILLCLALAPVCYGAIATFEADDYTPGESMHHVDPNVKLWRADLQTDDIPHVLEHCYPDICPIQSTLPGLPLGNNVIANPIGSGEGPVDYWYLDGPYLFLEINGWFKEITVSTAPKPSTLVKTCIIKGYDENFEEVMYAFDNIGRTIHRDKGDYEVMYAFIYVASPASLDNIILDYQPIPNLAAFIDSWLGSGCSVDNVWCNGCDINHDTYVDFFDYSRLCLYWSEEW